MNATRLSRTSSCSSPPFSVSIHCTVAGTLFLLYKPRILCEKKVLQKALINRWTILPKSLLAIHYECSDDDIFPGCAIHRDGLNVLCPSVGFVMALQFRYQRAKMYRKVALGLKHHMSVSHGMCATSLVPRPRPRGWGLGTRLACHHW